MSNELIPFIDLKAQYLDLQLEINARIKQVLEHGQYIMGPEVNELEYQLCEYVGTKYCITVASGTEALLISLMALGVTVGDEVITTPFTFAATAEVIVLLGAIPVFVDIEPDTCNLDAKKIEIAITPKTKCIIPVSLYGQPADMDEINTIAAKYQLPVIEDAAQSFGSEYKGRKSCNLSTIGCTSFFPSKPLGCYGDGGALFTNDELLAQICRELRVHGQSKKYLHNRIGVGGRMDTIQCAILLAKLTRFPWEVCRRHEIGNRYNKAFDKLGIKRVQQGIARTSVYAQYTIFLDDREFTQQQLSELGVSTAIHYPIPLNEQPAYKKLSGGTETPIASLVSNKVISLPMSAYLSEEQQSTVISALTSATNVT